MRRLSGFTLVELLVMLGIIGILTMIGLPPLLSWRATAALEGDARLLAADLQRMKVMAIKYNCPVVMQLSGTGYEMFIDDGSGGADRGDWLQTGSEQSLGERHFAAEHTITHTFSANRLRFTGSGGNKTGTFRITGRSGRQIAVVVSVLGRIRVSRDGT